MRRGVVRLAHVVSALDYGGVESTLWLLLTRLQRFSLSSLIVFVGPPGAPRREQFASQGWPIIDCPDQPGRRLYFIRALRSVFRSHGIDQVLCHCFGLHAFVSLAARLAGISQVRVRVGGSPLRRPSQRIKCLLLAQLARPFCRGEIAVSETIWRELVQGLRLPPARVSCIPNGCDVESIAARAERARLRAGQPPPFRILMAARMDDAKDHPTLLRACRQLHRKGLRLQLLLAGDGPRRSEHESLCRHLGLEGIVQFLGNRCDVPELLGTSQAAVLATHSEGSSMMLLEAMSAGTPIVATDIPACRETLQAGHCGLLVPPRDPSAISHALLRLTEDKRLGRDLSRRAFQAVSQRHHIDTAAQAYARLLLGEELPPMTHALPRPV